MSRIFRNQSRKSILKKHSAALYLFLLTSHFSLLTPHLLLQSSTVIIRRDDTINNLRFADRQKGYVLSAIPAICLVRLKTRFCIRRKNQMFEKPVSWENIFSMKFGNYSVLLRNPQFLHKVEKWEGSEKNQRNVNIQEEKKVVC